MQYKFSFFLLGVAMSALLVPQTAQAQDDDGYAEPELEEILVTGSRIKRLDAQLPTPVQIYDAGYIKNTGAANLAEFLFASSFAGPALFNENTTLSQQAGTSRFDSRGFGVDYVVILLNGRRLPADPQGGNNATNLNLIPIAAVERVEYLSTGATAIYGADAVQGVVNVITKQRYEGLEAELRYDAMSNGDGPRTALSVSGGVASDRGFATVSFDYQNQDSVSADGLPLIGSAIAPDGTDGRSPTGQPGTFVDFDTGTSFPDADCPQASIRPAQFTAAGSDCSFDVGPLYEAIPAQTRYNFLASGEYQFNDIATGYGEFRFSRNVTEVRNGAAPAFFEVTGAASLARIDAELGTDLANSSSVFMLRRAVDAGPRSRDATNSAFSNVLGIRVDVSPNHQLDLSVQNVESEQNQIGVGGNLSTSNVEAAVASGLFDPTETYDPQFFADNGLAISIQRQAVGTETELQGTLSGQLPLQIGDNAIGYALGGRFKQDDFDDRSDKASQEGDVAGGASSSGAGERDITSFFGELSLAPLDNLELSVAARYDDYSWSGLGVSGEDSATTYMAALSYRPLDNLLLRVSAGTGFKAPTLGQLFLGRSFGVANVVDTTLCNNARNDPSSTPAAIENACRIIEVRSVSGGNPELTTESSDNLSLGLVFEPTDSWSLALDYYDIQVEDIIGSLGVQELIANEDLFPGLVRRVGGSLSVPGAEVRGNLQNLTQEEGQGLDLSSRYEWAFDRGSLVGDVRVSYLLSHKRQSSALQPLCEDKGTTSEPEWRFNGQIGWNAPRWTAVLTARYIGETEDLSSGRDAENNSCAPNPNGEVLPVDSYLELGLRGTYTVANSTEISLGVVNLTDEEPPFSVLAAGAWPWFDQSLYDPRGTRWYLNLRHEFF
ncbi:MAG: TonB-dependent receptor [Pseudomonadota bacterium]